MRNPDDTIYKKTTFWGRSRCPPSPPPFSWSPALEEIHEEVYRIYIKRKLVTHSLTAPLNCKLQFREKQCHNTFQENMSTWAVPFCTWHSLQRFSSTWNRSGNCSLINGHTCSVTISWTSTACFGTITPWTPSRPLRFWNWCSNRLRTKWVEGWRLY